MHEHRNLIVRLIESRQTYFCELFPNCLNVRSLRNERSVQSLETKLLWALCEDLQLHASDEISLQHIDCYLTGKQSRSLENAKGPEYRFLISDLV